MAPTTTPEATSEEISKTTARECFTDEDPDFLRLKMRLLEKAGITTGTRLGSGTFSVVLRAVCHESHQAVALKVIDTRDGGDYIRRFLPREKEIIRPLIHSNIVRVWSIVHDGPFVVFITELCGGGDLLQKILSLTRIPEQQCKGMFRQLVAALDYLQSLNIIHRDLKCENIFLDSNDNLKLGDFGFARVLKSGDFSNTFCGSRAYVAPEVLSAKVYTGQATDIWSAGIVLFVMSTGLMPFDDRNPRRMLQKQTAHSVRFPRNVTLSAEVKKLVMDMLHPIPTSRPTCPELAASSWLQGVDAGPRSTPIN